MAYRPFHVPFLPGVHQDVDPAVIPAGGLARILNGRMPREGGITKRRGSSKIVDADSIGGPVDAVGVYRDRYTVMGDGRIWDRAPDEFIFREAGRAPRFLPRRAHFLHFNDTAVFADLPNSAAGVFDGVLYVATTWQAGTDVMLVVLNDKGARVFVHHEVARYGPRVIRTTTGFLWTYCREDTVGVYARALAAPVREAVPGLPPDPFALDDEPAQELGTKRSYTESYDICRSGPAGTSDEFLFMHRNNNTSISITRRSSAAPFTSSASVSITVTNSTLIAAQLFELDNDEVFYTWIDNGNDAYVGAAANDLTGNAESAVEAGDTITQVTLARRSATTAWLVYTNTTNEAVKAASVLSNGAINTTYDFGMPGMSILSRPHKADTSGFHVWLKNHIYPTTQAFQSKAVLARMNLDTTVALNVELIPDERPGFPNTTFRQAPLCAPANAGIDGTTDGGGIPHQKWWFPALVTIKTQPAKSGTAPVPADPTATEAVYLYEYEEATPPEDSEFYGGGDPLTFDTAAGAGFAFGGSGQEITSQRILKTTTAEPVGFENGSIAAPEITATATNGAGLTNGALYQVLACFEYVDSDGRVHRSCPSNLVSATVNATNAQVTVTWDHYPLTEREQSDKGTTHAVHVYATAANSSIFYRVTPDTSAPSATLANSFVITAEPNTSAAIIYTLGGTKPNQPAPAHRYGVTALGRAWLFGLFDPRIVECSKFFVPNEPATFTRDPSFRSFAPIDVFCGTEMDGVIYAFGADGIATCAPGIGPNNQGSPALPPFSLLSRTGCVGTGGLLRVPGGIMFEGRRGMYFLARGGSEPEFVGAPIAEDWPGVAVNEHGGCVRSAALLRHSSAGDLSTSLACFAYQSTDDLSFKVACFDPEARRWVGVDTGRSAHRLASWPDVTGDRLVTFPVFPADGPPSATIDANAAADFVSPVANSLNSVYTPISLSVETGWLRPFGLLGHGDIHEVTALVTVLDPEAQVSLETRRDGAVTWDATVPQSLSTYHSGGDAAAAFDDGPAKRLPGDVAILKWPMKAGRDVNSIRLRFTDSAVGPDGGIGEPQSARVIYHGVTLWTTPSDGAPLQGSARRVA